MAFLCPVRIRRNKKKEPTEFTDDSALQTPTLGRITGSSSIETLVRVGLEKEAGISADSRMTVLHDFSPCVDDELLVHRGDVVSLLYRENEWCYVIMDSRPPPNEGFIPYSYVTPLKPTSSGVSRNTNNVASATVSSHIIPAPVPFPKSLPGTPYISLYAFTARDENDVSCPSGTFVSVLNNEDPDWFWVKLPDGSEGFVPSAFLKCIGSEGNNSMELHGQVVENSDEPTVPADGRGTGVGVELVMLYDYKAAAVDDLTCKRGDWVHADLSVQTVQGWLWAYAPKQKKYGFIPKAYARPPAMTSL